MTTPEPTPKEEVIPTPAPPAGENGVGGDDKPRTYSQIEVDAKLRGQGKLLKDLQAEKEQRRVGDEERKRKDLESQGEYKTLLEQETAKREAAEASQKTLQDKEDARVKATEKSNAERVEKLSADLKELVPRGLAPDEAALHIAKLEARDAKQTAAANGVADGPGRADGKPLSDEDRLKRDKQRSLDKMLGKKLTDDK